HVYYVDRQIGELGRKSRGQIVAARFNEYHVEIGKTFAHVSHGREIGRRILADRGVWTAAGLDTGNTLRREGPGADQIFGIPLCVDVVGNRGDVVALAHALAQRVHERGLARSHGTSDADPERTVRAFHRGDLLLVTQLRNNRVYCVSCRMAAISARNTALPASSSVAASARL